MLTENVLLSCVAGAVGIGAAWVALRTIVNSSVSAYRDLQSVTLDWTVIAFAMSVSLVTAVVFGMLPALQISRLDVADVVRDAGRSTTAGPARSGFATRSSWHTASRAVQKGFLAGRC